MNEHAETLHAVDTTAPSRVLLIGDQQRLAARFGELLPTRQFDLVFAGSVADALEKAALARPKIILVSAAVFDTNGRDLVTRLKNHPITSHAPIVVTAASVSPTSTAAALDIGADDILDDDLSTEALRLRMQLIARLGDANIQIRRQQETLTDRNRRLITLLDLASSLGADTSLQPALKRIVDTARALSSCSCVTILLPDADRKLLRIGECHHMTPAEYAEIVLPIEAGIAGAAFRSDKSIVLGANESLECIQDPRETRITCGLPLYAAPLRSGTKSFGVLIASDRPVPQPFHDSELACLDLLSFHAAAALNEIFNRTERDEAHEAIVIALAKLAEHRDDDTGRHLDRVTQFCVTLAHELRYHGPFAGCIDDEFIHNLKLAVPLHDIGKVAVPDNILLKPAALDESEMKIMRTHVEYGVDIIRSALGQSPRAIFLKMAEDICHCHHEWYDGNGYPRGLCGNQIPISARITALADVYDALTTRRVYKPAMPHQRAYEIVVNASGTQFDPRVVQAFIDREQDFIKLARELADSPERTHKPASASPPARSTTWIK